MESIKDPFQELYVRAILRHSWPIHVEQSFHPHVSYEYAGYAEVYVKVRRYLRYGQRRIAQTNDLTPFKCKRMNGRFTLACAFYKGFKR